MGRRSALPGLLAIACAFALIGCSTPGSRNGATRRDDGHARLVPDPAFAGARIAVVFSDRALSANQCRFEWRRNGDLIPEARTSVLEPSSFAKGDRIEVAVVVPGTEPGGEQHLHAAISVANTPPRVTRVTVLPAATSARAEFRATPESLDPDGDPLTHTYRWFRNGNLIAAEKGASLPMAALALGDRIAVEVTASDGEAVSPPVRGDADAVENHPPNFTSQPAAPGHADSVFRYQALATDEDGERLRYELVSGPTGMTVEPGGSVLWTLPAGAQRSGEYAVTIRALDSHGGEGRQQFTIHLDSPVAKR